MFHSAIQVITKIVEAKMKKDLERSSKCTFFLTATPLINRWVRWVWLWHCRFRQLQRKRLYYSKIGKVSNNFVLEKMLGLLVKIRLHSHNITNCSLKQSFHTVALCGSCEGVTCVFTLVPVGRDLESEELPEWRPRCGCYDKGPLGSNIQCQTTYRQHIWNKNIRNI